MRLSLGTPFALLLTGAALHIGPAKAGFDDLPAVQEEQNKIASKAYKDQILDDVGSIMGDPETRQNFQHFIGILEADPAATAALAEGTIWPLLQTLEEALEVTVQEVNALTRQRDAAQQSADENRARAERFHNELQHLPAAHPNAQRLAHLEQERDAATERAHLAQEARQHAEDQLPALQRQVQEAEAARNDATERARLAQEAHEQAEQVANNTHAQLVHLEGELAENLQVQEQAEKEILDTRAELHDVKQENKAAQSQIQHLQSQIAAMNDGDYVTASVTVGGTDAILSRNIEAVKHALLTQQKTFLEQLMTACNATGNDGAKVKAIQDLLMEKCVAQSQLLGQNPQIPQNFDSLSVKEKNRHLNTSQQALQQLDLTQIPLPSLFDMTKPTTQNP